MASSCVLGLYSSSGQNCSLVLSLYFLSELMTNWDTGEKPFTYSRRLSQLFLLRLLCLSPVSGSNDGLVGRNGSKFGTVFCFYSCEESAKPTYYKDLSYKVFIVIYSLYSYGLSRKLFFFKGYWKQPSSSEVWLSDPRRTHRKLRR